jgi:16S rRNA (adenine1518-N6/adenine1519-N6)-dimethyltransferase
MVFAKKSLGQHFLTNKSYLRAIADAAVLRKGDTVVEIGPGKGSLTSELLRRNVQVVAVEKDHHLIPFLEEAFAEQIKSGQLTIVETDALDFEPSGYKLEAGTYKLIGNIPYYITGALLQKFLTDEVQPETIVFLVQKEVAERIARSKKESILSLSVKAYGTPKYIKTVPAGAFAPSPKVDSAILQISNISRNNFVSAEHEARFFKLLKAGFAHKRKQLGRNLEPSLGPSYSKVLENIGISSTARAEDVSLQKWLKLAKQH